MVLFLPWEEASRADMMVHRYIRRQLRPSHHPLTKRLERLMMQGMRQGLFIIMMFVLTACATSPPVQEMAAARSAISIAKAIPHGGSESIASLKSAEQALAEAARSIDEEHYGRARRLAVKARQKAQMAAKLKQKGQ